jgi:hypothetical protein
VFRRFADQGKGAMTGMEQMIAAAVTGFILLVVGDSMREKDWGIWLIGAGIVQFLIVVFYTIESQLS